MKQKTEPVEKISIEEAEPLIKSIIDSIDGATEEGICLQLDYNEGYISQLRSREKKTGKPQVSKKFFNQLKSFPLQNANFQALHKSKFNSTDPAYIAGQLAMAERLIAKLESDHEDAKADKKQLFDALTETRQTINELLKPMVVSLKGIPPVLDLIVRNSNEHDKEIMTALDHLVGNKPGTLEKESGKRILKNALERQKTDKKDGAHKQHKL